MNNHGNDAQFQAHDGPSTTHNTIADLLRIVDNLDPASRERFERFFQVSVYTGRLQVPAEMHSWVEERFGSVGAVESQTIVRVTNKITLEGALYNPLRAGRPIEFRDQSKLHARIMMGSRDEPFAKPLERTPADPFGRIEGEYGISAANVAKFDVHHGLVIFREHNPLRFSRESLMDYIDVSQRWIDAAHQQDPDARYPLIIWNCLWRAGGSVTHGHFQLAITRDMHYPRVERLRRAAVEYKREYQSDYFSDWLQVHSDLGCATQVGNVGVVSHLAPAKDQEIILISDRLDNDFKEVLYKVLAAYISRLGVTSFNMAISLPPLGATSEDWSGFPVMARLVDRGDADSRTSDIGAMELYAQNVVASDPLTVLREVSSAFGETS